MIFRSRYSLGKVAQRSSKSIGAHYQQKKAKRKKTLNFFKKILLAGVLFGSVCSLILGIYVAILYKDLPSVSAIETYIPAETTKILSTDGVVLAELYREENRAWINLNDISPALVQTVIAVEDSNFYKHGGLDFKGILRAIVKDIQAMSFVEGGSTLTQQLARNLFLHRRRKISRKIAEAVLAVQIERKYSKDSILEFYLNQVYWGHNAYGIQSASLMYFGKSAQELTLAESALLVGMLTGPELYSPYRNLKGAKRRQKIVLNRMSKLDLISKEQASRAYQEDLDIQARKKFRYKAPYFTTHVIQQLIEMFGEEEAYTSGMRVYTTLNYKLQEKAEAVVKKYVDYGKTPKWVRGEKVPSLNYQEGALLALDPRNGHIIAMQGGEDFQKNQFNRTTQAYRQPGSSFKPFVYYAALEKGFSPGSFFEDKPVTFNTIEGPYSPRNYTQKYLGNLPMRKALERSVNVVAIKLNYLVGPENVVNVTKKIGIKSNLKPILSLPLGANEVTMLDLVSSYGAFANAGRRVEPTAIIRIEDRDGIPLYEHKLKEERVASAKHVAVLVDMLKGVVKFGTGKNANLPRPVAGKTGTTSDYRDAWFVGFVPQLVCAAWVGNDDNSSTYKITGGWVPALMWKGFMKEAMKDIVPQDFPPPRGLVERKVDWTTGGLATQFSPEDKVTTEKYWKGSEPTHTVAQKGLFDAGDSSSDEDTDSSVFSNFFNSD